MQHCGTKYGIYLRGHWQWFDTYQAAAQAEGEALRADVQSNLAQGKNVILTQDQARKSLKELGRKLQVQRVEDRTRSIKSSNENK